MGGPNGNGSYSGEGYAARDAGPRAFPPGAPPAPASAVTVELSTQNKILEECAAAMSRVEMLVEPVLRSEPDAPSGSQVEKRSVEYAGSSSVARAINENSNSLVYLLRRLNRMAERLEA